MSTTNLVLGRLEDEDEPVKHRAIIGTASNHTMERERAADRGAVVGKVGARDLDRLHAWRREVEGCLLGGHGRGRRHLIRRAATPKPDEREDRVDASAAFAADKTAAVLDDQSMALRQCTSKQESAWRYPKS